MSEPKIKYYTEDEIQILRKMVADCHTDKEIAEVLGRTPLSVSEKRRSLNLQKGDPVIPSSMKNLQPQVEDKMVKERAEMIAWKTHFKSTVKYKRLTKQYTSEDLEYFTEQWAYYHIQFENLTQTEEDSIDLLIDFKIRLENNRKQYKDLEIHEAQVREKLGNNMDQELDLENEEQRYLYEMLTSINKHRLDINKDVKELTEKYEKIQRSLNATREQREASTKIGGDTFLTLVREMNNNDRREQIGKWNEYLKLATRQKLEALKKNHTFDDGVIEPIIMDGKDYKGKKDENTDNGNSGTDGTVSNSPSGK